MAVVNHDLLETIQMAIKLSKLEQHPIGSLWATMSNDDPANVFGGGETSHDYAAVQGLLRLGAHCLERGCANG